MTYLPQAPGNRGLKSVSNTNVASSKKQNTNLRITRLRELDREFNREAKELALLAKKLKSKIMLKSGKS